MLTLLIATRELRNRKLRWSCKDERISWNDNVLLLRLRLNYARKLLRLSCVRRQLGSSNAKKLWQRRRENFEQQERERKELLDTQLRRELTEAAERKERKEAQETKERLEL